MSDEKEITGPLPIPRGPYRDAPVIRRRGVPLLLAVVLVAIALAGGVLIGYGVRGEPAPASLVTEEREVPVVTLTVER